MLAHHTITYAELPAREFEKTKSFFETVFNWEFQNWGPDYSAFTSPTIEVGFFRSEEPLNSSTLLVFFSDQLEQSYQAIVDAGGTISKDVFDFPGGRRFHFTEPSGNEFAIWSNKRSDGTLVTE